MSMQGGEHKTHWKKLNNPDYLGAWALEPGQELILTIQVVKKEMVTGADGKKEECTVVYFNENVKPMILNTTNAKTIQKVYKTPYIEDWAGKKIQIYSENVRAFGDWVDALRIRPFEPKEQAEEEKIACQNCGQVIKSAGNVTAGMLADQARKKFGKALCLACVKEAAKKQNEETPKPEAQNETQPA